MSTSTPMSSERERDAAIELLCQGAVELDALIGGKQLHQMGPEVAKRCVAAKRKIQDGKDLFTIWKDGGARRILPEAHTQWISVADGLPPLGEWVLTHGGEDGMEVGWTELDLAGNPYLTNGWCAVFATHWLPLPPTPTPLALEQGKP